MIMGKDIITSKTAIVQPSEKEILESLDVDSNELLNTGNIEFVTDEEMKKHLDANVNR